MAGLLTQDVPSAVAFSARVVTRNSSFKGFNSHGVGKLDMWRPLFDRNDMHLRHRLVMAGRNEGNGNDGSVDDPNPGGLNQWGGDGNKDKRSFNDMGFFEQVREWIASDEGKEDVKTYTVSLGVALLIRLLIIEPRYIPSLSMYPTFEVGDQLAVEKVTKRFRPFKRNEVVVFNPPLKFREIVGDSSRKAKEALIKRIVAVEVRM